MDANTQPVIYMVHNDGEYSAYEVLALFTDKALADAFAAAAFGVVQEWPANVPKESWYFGTAHLFARKQDGRWEVSVNAWPNGARIGQTECSVHFGHYSGWGVPDPKTGEYTHAQVTAQAASADLAKKICVDAFWKRVAELEQ